jgi:hypothetical protein
MDGMRLETVQNFKRLLDWAKKEQFDFSEAWFRGIAKRAKADPESKTVAVIVSKLSAYHEFEQVKLQIALQSKDYNAEKHQNDLLDAEQLIYLGDPSLCFLTCDSGFGRITKSAQRSRLKIVAPEELSDVEKIEALLRQICS